MTRHRFIAHGCAALASVAFAADLAAQGGRSNGASTQEQGRGTDAKAGALLHLVRERVLLINGQSADDPFSGPVVTGAPFSADAINTTTQVLGDGTRIEQSTTTRYYRDGAGRLRSEQTILGLGALNPAGGESRTIITVDPDPGDGFVYTLDPLARTARRVTRGTFVYAARVRGSGPAEQTAVTWVTEPNAVVLRLPQNGGAAAQTTEPLGTRQMEGVTVTGWRSKSVIPLGAIGNDRPIEISTERWESPDLRLLVRSLQRDPRTGDVEYRLTNIVRAEPPADLFTIPADYQVLGDTPGGAGQRSGGGGGRGVRRGGGQ